MNNKLKKNGKIRGRIVKADYSWVDKTNLNDLPDVPLENKVTAEDMNYLNAMMSKQSLKHGAIVDNTHPGITVAVSVSLPNIKYIFCDISVKYGEIYEPVAFHILPYHGTIKLRNNAMNTDLTLTHNNNDNLEVTVTNTINQPIQWVYVNYIYI
jgi:hypothetical protein